MTYHEIEQMRRAQRRNMALITVLCVGVFFVARATIPETASVPTGLGYDICTDRSC